MGNGSSDVFSAIAATDDSNEVNTDAAFIIGTTLFITTIVKSAVLYVSKEG
jgi:hypothetical protein